MKKIKIKKRVTTILVLLILCLKINAQINLTFVKHLSKQKLKNEHLTYLNLLNSPSDSINYLKAKYYLQYFNDSLFFSTYINSKSLFLKDSNALNLANVLFLKSSSIYQDSWFNSLRDIKLNTSSEHLVNLYKGCFNPLTMDMSLVPFKLRNDFLNYKMAAKKNILLATSLSTVVPGLGELYIGRKKSFVATLITNLAYGFQSYESIKRFGIQNSLSVINLSFLSVFYLANIYGTYRDVKQVKRETKKQFLINASDYYYTDLDCKLY